MARDMELLDGVRGCVGDGCAVSIYVGDVNEFCRFDFGFRVRWVRIHEKAIRCMRDDWGWELMGKWEVVGDGHEFEDEVLWMQCLDLSPLSEAFHRDRARVERERVKNRSEEVGDISRSACY